MVGLIVFVGIAMALCPAPQPARNDCATSESSQTGAVVFRVQPQGAITLFGAVRMMIDGYSNPARFNFCFHNPDHLVTKSMNRKIGAGLKIFDGQCYLSFGLRREIALTLQTELSHIVQKYIIGGGDP